MEAVTEKKERGAESVQRWTAKRRSALVLSILRGKTSAQGAARKHGLPVAEIEGWQERYLLAAENALRSRPRDEEALKDEQILLPLCRGPTTPISLLSVVLRQAADFSAKCVA